MMLVQKISGWNEGLNQLWQSRAVLTPVLFFTFLFGLIFWPFWFGSTFGLWDNFSLMVPGKMFTVAWLQQGVLPFWNPHLFGGIGWIGDINQSILYPSTLLFLWLPTAMALNVTIVTHLVWSALGMYWLSRRLVSTRQPTVHVVVAVIWAISQQFAGSLNNIATLQSMAWTPWVVLAGVALGSGRTLKLSSLAAVSAAVWFQLAGGYPQHVMYSVVMAGLVSLLQQMQVQGWSLAGYGKAVVSLVWRWSVALGLTGLITAVLWLPFLELVAASTRTAQTSQQSTVGSLSLAELPKLLLPYIFDHPAAGMKWGPSWSKPPLLVMYLTWFGTVALGLRLFLQKKTATDWWLLAGVVTSGLVAFGSNLPGFSVLQQFIPVLRFTRGPSIVLMVTLLLSTLLVGRALADWFQQYQSKSTLWWWRAVVVATVGLSLLGAVGWLTSWLGFEPVWTNLDALLGGKLAASPFHTMERDQVIVRIISQNIFVASISFGLSLWFWRRRWLWLVVALVVADLVYSSHGHLLFVPSSVYDTSQLVTEQASDLGQILAETDQRVLIRNYNAPYSDFGAYMDAVTLRAPFTDSYVDASELQTFDHLRRMRDGLTPDWHQVAEVPSITGYTTLLPQDVSQRWNQTEVAINDLEEIEITNPLLLDWAVKYYLVDTWFPLYEGRPDLPLVANSGSWELYELPAKPRIRFGNDSPVAVQHLSETPNSVHFSFENSQRYPELIMADRYDPNWHATVNGQPVEVQNQVGMRQVPIQPGLNQVELRYVPVAFFRGLQLTGLGILGLAAIFWLKHTKDQPN